MRRLMILVVLSALGCGLAACDWSEFRYGPDQTGYNPGETTISTSNVSKLVQTFSASLAGSTPTGGVTTANGVAYVGVSGAGQSAYLEAFDAAGVNNCSGTPATCTPLWTSTNIGYSIGLPIIANGLTYVLATYPQTAIYVFDAAGHTDCSGTPKVCQPLWSYPVDDGAPTIVGNTLYVSSHLDAQQGGLGFEAFDASGNTNCSGTPKICTPLWTAPVEAVSVPTVANGNVYLSTDAYGITLQAYDASGTTNCSGTPKVCSPLWSGQTASTSLYVWGGQPSVANGTVYVLAGSNFPSPFSNLYAFDASGSKNCSGTPTLCQPLWTASKPYNEGFAGLAVAYGIVYAGSGQGLAAYDASGVTNCSGTPTVCDPLWTSDPTVGLGEPSVANGVVYTMGSQTLYAFDAGGKLDCSGTPATCNPLWIGHISIGYIASSLSIANGRIYLTATQTLTPAGGGDSYLDAFGLP